MEYISFLGLTALQAISSMPPEDQAFYLQYLQASDTGYYASINRQYEHGYGYKSALNHKGEIEQCVLISAQLNKLDPIYIRTIMRLEAGWPGAKVNGDYGIMQISRMTWSKELKKINIVLDWETIADEPCENIFLGSYILSLRIKEAETPIEGIANYHRYLTDLRPLPHLKYRLRAVNVLSNLYKEKLNWVSQKLNSNGER